MKVPINIIFNLFIGDCLSDKRMKSSKGSCRHFYKIFLNFLTDVKATSFTTWSPGPPSNLFFKESFIQVNAGLLEPGEKDQNRYMGGGSTLPQPC